MLNTLLSEYSVQAEKKGILFDVYVEPGCVIKQIKDIDLVFMVGNLFDNAIEASLNIRDASIFTRIFMHKNGKMCIIKIVNDFTTERLMIVKMLKSYYYAKIRQKSTNFGHYIFEE